MGRPTLTAKARGRSGCRGPFPGGDEESGQEIEVEVLYPCANCARVARKDGRL